jgi:hypothetical protein
MDWNRNSSDLYHATTGAITFIATLSGEDNNTFQLGMATSQDIQVVTGVWRSGVLPRR